MSAKLSISLCLFMLSVAPMCGQTVLLNEAFEKGIPAGYTTLCNDGMNVLTQHFKNGSPQSEWFTANPGKGQNNSQAAYSCSLRQYETIATDNWLITPQISVSTSDMWLTWDAHSVHHELPESYKVMISTTGDNPEDFTELFSTDEENYRWTHHLVSLADYKGKDVYIAFVHCSTNKYLLAIDNLFVGELSEPLFTATDLTLHSAGEAETAPVKGIFRNDGPKANIASVECTLGNGQVLLTIPTQSTMLTGEERKFNFDVPITLNCGTKYEVDAVTTDGLRYKLASDSIYCTTYPRTMMMDKLTAYWCNNCPQMNLLIYDLEEHFGKQFAEVSVQFPSNLGTDVGNLTCATFLENMNTVNLPRAYYNRLMQKPQDAVSQTDIIDYAIRRPCNALVTLESATLRDGQITVKLQSEFADDLSNANDKYRIGLTLVEKRAVTDAKQANGLTLASNNEYYFLPAVINQPMALFVNVARGTDVAFSGIASTYPTEIEAHKSYPLEYTFDVPSGVSDARAENMAVVAYVLNTANGEALNADKMDVTDASLSSIGYLTSSATESLATCTLQGDDCIVSFNGNARGVVSIYTVDGSLVIQNHVARTRHTLSLAQMPAGCYIVKASTSEVSHTFKIVKQ